MRIGLVTEEFAGFTKSGGIGTCARGLAVVLLALGYDVEVIITDPDYDGSETPALMGGRPITFIPAITLGTPGNYVASDSVARSYAVYELLREKAYDVVHLNDWKGSGFYLAMGRRQGLVNSYIVTHTHGSTEWVRTHNLSAPVLETFEIEALERSQIENSDLVVSPSRYLLDWYRGRGVKLPKTEVINWVLPQWAEKHNRTTDLNAPLSTRALRPGVIDELIFFGRHERRKGFNSFVSAIAGSPRLHDLSLLFLGRFDQFEEEFSGSYVLRRLSRHPRPIRFINDLDQKAALDLVASRPKSLCVMPSVIENSPCVVGECLTLGIPFVASAVGGTPELLEPESAAAALSNPSAEGLALRIESIRKSGLGPIYSSFVPAEVLARWADLHRSLSEIRPAKVKEAQEPLVSICVTHFERPALLKRALSAIEKQTYPHIEVVVVDDGSKSPSSKEALDLIERSPHRFPVRVIRSENKYLGAARNLAAHHSQGDWLLFHDDDNIAEPKEVETFVSAALNGSFDILTCQYLIFNDFDGPEHAKMEYFPIGIGGVFSLFRNRFGDANALVRRTAFEAVGGFTELKGVGWEDWELFLKAYFQKFQMGVVPEPLFRYRASSAGMLSTGSAVSNNRRIVDAAIPYSACFGSELLEYARGKDISEQVAGTTQARLSREAFSAMHLELMELDPNSHEARRKLVDLALAIGRVGDAVELGLSRPELRSGLLETLRGRATETYSLEAIELEGFGDPASAVLVTGWIGDPDLRFEDVPGVLVGGETFRVVGWARSFRPDVNQSLETSDRVERGFTALAVKGTAPGKGRHAARRLPQLTSIEKEVRLLMSDRDNSGERALKGHIDELKVGCYFDLGQTFEEGTTYMNRIELAVANRETVTVHVGSEIISDGQRAPGVYPLFSLPGNDLQELALKPKISFGAFTSSERRSLSLKVFKKNSVSATPAAPDKGRGRSTTESVRRWLRERALRAH